MSSHALKLKILFKPLIYVVDFFAQKLGEQACIFNCKNDLKKEDSTSVRLEQHLRLLQIVALMSRLLETRLLNANTYKKCIRYRYQEIMTIKQVQNISFTWVSSEVTMS